MSTLDKLLVQIFDKKVSIVEQVRQHTESYTQYLGSKLLADGITPPSWLFESTSSSNSKELNKDELISKLLRQHPQHSIRCSVASYPVYNRLVAKEYGNESSPRLFNENPSFETDLNRQDDPEATAIDKENAECPIYPIHELGSSVGSPKNQMDERILNIYSAPDQSVAQIQRSKSRQKALELRSSAKVQAKSCLSHENKCNASSHVRFSLSTPNGGQKNVAELEEPRFLGSYNDEADIITKEEEKDLYSGRITRSRSNAEVARDSSSLCCAYGDQQDASNTVAETGRRSIPELDHAQGDNFPNKSPKSGHASAVCSQSCGNKQVDANSPEKGKETDKKDSSLGIYNDVADFLTKEKKDKILHSGRITRSRSGKVVRDSTSLRCTSGSRQNGVSSSAAIEGKRSISVFDHEHRDNSTNKLPKLAIPSAVSSQSWGNIQVNDAFCTNKENVTDKEPCFLGNHNDEADLLIEEKEKDLHSGRSTRSRSNAELVTDSSSLCSTSGDGQYKASNILGKGRRSTSVSDHGPGDHVSMSTKSARPSAVCGQSCGNKRVNDAYCLNKENEMDISTGINTRSKSSCEHRRSSSFSSDHQRIDIAMKDPKVDGLLPDYVDGSPVRVSFNALGGGSEAGDLISEDCNCSSQHNGVSDLEIPCHSANADNGTIAAPSGKSCQLVDDSNELFVLGKPSIELSPRRTGSKPSSTDQEMSEPGYYVENPKSGGTQFKIHRQQKSANDELQNSGYRSVPSSDGNHNMHIEPQLLDPVDQSGNSSSRDFKQMPTPPGSFVSAEPIQTNFNETEEQNLTALTSGSGKRRLDNSIGQASCSLPVSALSLNNGIYGGVNQLPFGQQSHGGLDVSIQGNEATTDRVITQDSLEFNALTSSLQKRSLDVSSENMNCFLSDPAVSDKEFSGGVNILSIDKKLQGLPDVSINVEEARNKGEGNWGNFKSDAPEDSFTLAEKHELGISDATVRTTPKDDRESDLDYQVPEARQVVEHKLETLPDQQKDEGNCADEVNDKGFLISNVPESKNSGPSHSHNSADEPRTDYTDSMSCKAQVNKTFGGTNGKINKISAQKPLISCLEDEICGEIRNSPPGCHLCDVVGSPHDESLSFVRRLRSGNMESWPQPRKRKIEHQKTCNLTSSSISRVRIPHNIQSGHEEKYSRNMEIDLDTDLMDTVFANKDIDVEIQPKMSSYLAEGIESTSQKAEVAFSFHETNIEERPSLTTNPMKLGETVAIKQGSLVEGVRTPHSTINDTNEQVDGECSQHLCRPEKSSNYSGSSNLTCSNVVLEGTKSLKWEDGPMTELSDDLDLDDARQYMPVFEGFTVDAGEESGELDFAATGIDISKMKLPKDTIERASILVEICKSASLDTPLPHFSSSFEFQDFQNLFQSLSNDHLTKLPSSLPSNSDVEVPDSGSLAYSEAQYNWDSRNWRGSPVGKMWDRLSSHTGSSEKHSCSNPELVCFPIEEDPRTCEENRSGDEHADDDQEEVSSSSADHRDGRQLFKDLTNLDLNPCKLVSAKDESLKAGTMNFASTKLSDTGTQVNAQLSVKNRGTGARRTRGKQPSSISSAIGPKNQTLSVDTNAIRKIKESITSSVSKSILSSNATSRKQDQKVSLKETRKNNIVSNVSSFIPLVQQKPVATVAAGKRDVKVKALEAAEAARRLEEKRDNERKMRKEALKVERAKLEEKNLRDKELLKKRKEEERKKKDVDNIEKKRQREEEFKREKEKKRMRLETKKHQKEQVDKMRTVKAEKEKQSKDEQMNRKKVPRNEAKSQLDIEITKSDVTDLKKQDIYTQVVMDYEECNPSNQFQECGEEDYKSPKGDLTVNNKQEKSYEITPYQCSDDEDEEEDELPSKKSIPSWASKSSVALLLPLQRDIDPVTIFPPESFCSMDDVLLPRKLQQKQAVA